jgi:hypothetical protein
LALGAAETIGSFSIEASTRAAVRSRRAVGGVATTTYSRQAYSRQALCLPTLECYLGDMTSKSSHLAKEGAAAGAAKRLALPDGASVERGKARHTALLAKRTALLQQLRALGITGGANDEADPAAAKEQLPALVTLNVAGPSPEHSSVAFGSVTVKGGGPAPATVKHNIASGRSALKRGLSALIKPGVKLPRGKGIPIYHADPNDPTILIRELNGRDERGTLVDGEFKIAK